MESSWILVVGYDRKNFVAAQKEWLKYNVLLHLVDTVPRALEQLGQKQYLAVAVSYDVPDMSPLVEALRGNERTPLLVLSPQNTGIDLAKTLIWNADAFIIDPDKLEESIEKSKEILDRYAHMPLGKKEAIAIFTHRDIFMIVDYRMVFVHGEEVSLTKNDFDILELLLSHAGRVFTYEEIYHYAYGENGPIINSVNAVRCQVKRIRQKLDVGPEPVQYIDVVRSVGYRIAVF